MQAEIMDQPTALDQRYETAGIVKNTLVFWCTEFGRMPFLQVAMEPVESTPMRLPVSSAGAGVKKGYTYGKSDNFGFKSVEGKSSVYDFNATILHLMGLDHERLSYYHNGLERRLPMFMVM